MSDADVFVPEPPTPDSTFWYRFGRTGCAWMLKLYNRLSIEGRENVPTDGPFLMVSNHQSLLDIPILGAATDRHLCFVARGSLADSKVLGWWLHQCRSILIQPGAPDRAALRAIEAHLELGDAVAIFPEGTRSRDGSLQTPRGGAFFSARRAGVPIVPVGISGAIDAWPRDARLPAPKKIVLRIGTPLDGRDRDAPDRCWEQVRALVGSPAAVDRSDSGPRP
ncbi:MAG: lysophospholipid acyltransferase family protein [Planctomycetota bacterium]